jgi:hypothetical protein
MRNVLAATLVAAAAVISTPLAADTSSPMAVSVQVIGRAIVTVDSRPDVEVTEADLARGYVDVAQPLQLSVQTNSRKGYLLQAAKTSETFSAVELAFDTTQMTVALESWVSRPYIAGRDLVSMKVRVRLAPDATAGRHPLALEFSALPL